MCDIKLFPINKEDLPCTKQKEVKPELPFSTLHHSHFVLPVYDYTSILFIFFPNPLQQSSCGVSAIAIADNQLFLLTETSKRSNFS